MKKTKVKTNKRIYLDIWILDISKRLLYDTALQGRAKLCYMDNDKFVIYIKTEGIADDVGKWLGTSNYSKNDSRLLLMGWNEKNSVFLKMN